MSIGIGHFWIAFLALGLGFLLEYLLLRRNRRLPAELAVDTVPQGWQAKYLYALIILFLLVTLLINLGETGYQHFAHLANSIISGHLYLLENPDGIGDVVSVNGHDYWPLGPFPSVALMPLAWVARGLGGVLYQGLPQAIVVLGVFLIVLRVARRLEYDAYESALWAFAFTFATMFLGVAMLAKSWYFAQTVGVLLCWWMFHEYFGKRRYLFIGILAGCLVATRLTAALVLVFFLLDLLNSDLTRRQKWTFAAQLLAPSAVGVVLLGLYNAARFGNPLETGYTLQTIGGFLLASRAHGVFSLAHVPGNLYFALLSGPLPVFLEDGSQVLRFPFVTANAYGMSVFLTSPYMLLMLLLRYRDTFARLALLTVLIIAIPVVSYYGVGYAQLGYRYALDFWPLLFLLFMKLYRQSHTRLSARLQFAIVASAFTNFYLYLTIFGVKNPLVAF